MTRFKFASSIAIIACLLCGSIGQTAFAHGGGHGGGGHGGGHSGGGHMGGGHHGGGGHHYGGGGYYGGSGFYGGGLGFYGLGYGLGYGSGYGRGYGYSSPYYYNNQYYTQPVQSYPVYSTPQYINTTPALPAPDGGQVILFVPADAARAVQYTINGESFTLKPGESQTVVNDRRLTIEFPPTSGGQIALRYTLLTGRYKFKPSGSGMGLFQTQDAPPTQVASPPVPQPPAN